MREEKSGREVGGLFLVMAVAMLVGGITGWGLKEASSLPRVVEVPVAATCMTWYDSKGHPHTVLSISNDPTSTLTLLKTRDGDYYVPRDKYTLKVVNCLGD